MNYERYKSNLFYLIVCIFLILGSTAAYNMGIDDGVMEVSYQYAFILIPVILYILLTRQKFTQVLRLKKTKPLLILIAFLIALVSQPAIALIDTLMKQVVGGGSSMMMPQPTSNSIWFALFLFAVTPAICEEVLMRGAVLYGHRHVPIWKAAILNGVLFGLFHNNFDQLFYTTAFGILLAIVVTLSDSIYPAILMHFVMNALSVFGEFYPNSTYMKFTTWYESDMAILIPIGIVSIAATAALVIWLRKITKKDKAEQVTEQTEEATTKLPMICDEEHKNVAYPEWPLLMATAISIIYSMVYM